MLAKCREIALESEIPSTNVNFLSNGNMEKVNPTKLCQCQRRVFGGKARLAQTSVIASLFVVKSDRLCLELSIQLSTPPPPTQLQHLQSNSNRHQYRGPSVDFVLETPTIIVIYTTAADFSTLPFLLACQQKPIVSTKTLSDTLPG